MSPLYFLRIEVDGHFHGGPPVKPWVAEITGPCPRFGLARSFLRPMNDWANASRSWRGNIYGVVATFPLREGRVYEYQRCEGNSSKRRVVRKFIEIIDGKRRKLDPLEVLARVDGGQPGAVLVVDEPAEPGSVSVGRIKGLGEIAPLGFVLNDTKRRYRLADGGVFAVVRDGRRGILGVRDGKIVELDEREAWSWLG